MGDAEGLQAADSIFERGQIPENQQISAETWEQIKTAYGSGIGCGSLGPGRQ
jgi:hypothetical protein